MAKRICISIAVSKPEKLEPLPGAITASNDILGWARAAGFDPALSIDDSDEIPVTVERLRALLIPILSDPTEEIDHLIVHFAGHGFAADAEDQYLLLNNWWTNPDEAIRLGRFVRLLKFYQPNRVSLFIDACRTRSAEHTDDLNGSGILGRPGEKPFDFLQDRFHSAAHATESYMIRDPVGGKPQCLFTTVLLRVLCGAYPEAIETRDANKVVTSGGIYSATQKQIEEESKRFRIDQKTNLIPGFIAPRDIYTRLPIAYTPPILPTSVFDASGMKNIGIPVNSEPAEFGRTEPSANYWRVRMPRIEVPHRFEIDSGLVLSGAAVRGVQTSNQLARMEPDKVAGAGWLRLSSPDPSNGAGANVAIELADGPWIGATMLPDMVLSISVGPSVRVGPKVPKLAPTVGAVSMIYYPAGVLRRTYAGVTDEIITKLGMGALSADDAMSVAAEIRHMKHVDPVLGTVAAYLYDAAGDRDSIRRLAWFYARHGQPIPFDVALLGDLKSVRENGRYAVVVPAVAERTPRTPEEERHRDYFCATTEIRDAAVAGGFPWLRQGWCLLDAVDFPVLPALVEIAGSLLPMPFTTLKPEAGRVLADFIRRGDL